MDFDGLMFLKVSEFALDEQRRKAMFEQVKSDFLFLIKSIYGNEKEKKDILDPNITLELSEADNNYNGWRVCASAFNANNTKFLAIFAEPSKHQDHYFWKLRI